MSEFRIMQWTVFTLSMEYLLLQSVFDEH